MKTRSIFFLTMLICLCGTIFAQTHTTPTEPSHGVSIADSPREFSPTEHSEDFAFVYDDSVGSLLFTTYMVNSMEGLRITALHPCSVRTLEYYCLGPGTLEVRIWEVDSLGWPLNTEMITPFQVYIDSSYYFPSWEEVELPEPLYLPAYGECVVGRRVTSAVEPVTVYLSSMEDVEDRSFIKRSSPTWQKPTYYDDTLGMQWDVTFMIRAYGDYYHVPDDYWFSIDSSITTTNKGVAFGDFDMDGDFDMLTGGQLFGNNSGSFSIVSGTGMSSSGKPYWGEFDLNQYPDPYMAGDVDKLFANSSGSGDFYDVTSVAGGIDDPYPSECATWTDYDNDGDLDLYVVNGGEYDWSDSSWNFYRDFFYENDGAYFFEVTDDAGMSSTIYSPQYGSGIALGDWNNDGRTDIYVANAEGQANYLWRNDGGEFMDIGYGIGVDGVNEGGGVFGSSYGACLGDIDNDDDLDLFVANYSPGRNAPNSDKSFLYINLGPPDYYMWDESASRGIDFVKSCALPFMIDFDNDGWLDIFVASINGKSFAHLYHNLGDGTFEDVSIDAGLSLKEITGAGWSDIDGDGDLDLVAEAGTKKLICENEYDEVTGIDNNWARFICRGDSSNGLGVGAKVKLLAGGQWQYREIGTGYGGPGCQSEAAAHFGLGSATSIDSVIVEWPDGDIEVATDLAINMRYNVHEGTFDVPENKTRPTDLALHVSPNPFNSAVSIIVDCRGLINQTPTVEIYDVNGRHISVIPDPDRESRGVAKNLDSRFHGNDKMFIWQPGENTGSGVYLVRAKVGNESISKRVVYLK